MKGPRNIYVVVADSSTIIRGGLIAVLKRMPNYNIQSTEIGSIEALHHTIRSHEVDIVLVNPYLGGGFNLSEFKAMYPQVTLKFAAVVTNLTDNSLLKEYDECIYLYDNLEEITTKFARLMQLDDDETSDMEQEALSQREKEIVCYVVKGMTNKEIAEKLFISVHTVITHRRNITRKLQIHSPAGLTIYAMVNKLVDIKDVNVQ